mmetsp:Transcript_21206/g.42229  ORF Transcript_21206/g.42229 Transcript_21206/m.42229 type:complete len:355 (-) Transcript_21206:351-1415(-)
MPRLPEPHRECEEDKKPQIPRCIRRAGCPPRLSLRRRIPRPGRIRRDIPWHPHRRWARPWEPNFRRTIPLPSTPTIRPRFRERRPLPCSRRRCPLGIDTPSIPSSPCRPRRSPRSLDRSRDIPPKTPPPVSSDSPCAPCSPRTIPTPPTPIPRSCSPARAKECRKRRFTGTSCTDTRTPPSLTPRPPVRRPRPSKRAEDTPQCRLPRPSSAPPWEPNFPDRFPAAPMPWASTCPRRGRIPKRPRTNSRWRFRRGPDIGRRVLRGRPGLLPGRRGRQKSREGDIRGRRRCRQRGWEEGWERGWECRRWRGDRRRDRSLPTTSRRRWQRCRDCRGESWTSRSSGWTIPGGIGGWWS